MARGSGKQREAWENRYAEAERRHKMHTAQMEKTAVNETPGDEPADDGVAKAATEKVRGPHVSDADIAALREHLGY